MLIGFDRLECEREEAAAKAAQADRDIAEAQRRFGGE